MVFNQKGLTLIEILITVAILATISSLAVPTAARTYENMQKDAVLDQALQIERTAENYCLRAFNTCEIGEEVPSEAIEEFTDGPEEDYTYSVKRTGTRSFAVHYATHDGYSFPYDAEGKLMTKEASPSEGGRDMVNIPASFDSDDDDAHLDFPTWTSGTFEVGDRVQYDGNIYEIRHGGGIHSPPEPSNLTPYGPFQEVEIGNEFRLHNTYSPGDTVTFDGMTYEMNHAGGNGVHPDTTTGWNALTTVWQPTNRYLENDTVIHEGQTYQAHHGGATGTEPGTPESSGIWQNISSDTWVSTNIYHSGDEVKHDDVRYEARWWTVDDEPGQSNVWDPVDEGNGTGRWSANTVYQAGDKAMQGQTVYEAQWYTVGENPKNHSGPYEVWQPVDD